MDPVVLVGVPTALGGHLPGMERTPAELRRRGLGDRLVTAGLDPADLRDTGDVAVEPGFVPDPDPRAKNRARIAELLPRVADHVATAVHDAGPAARLLVVGGDCTAHAGAMAGIRRAGRAQRIGVAWLDAHGDLNTPDTTGSGNVWGMPFAMLLGHGDADLVAACDGPTARRDDAALLGAQVLDEPEARLVAASPIALFGAGMLATAAGFAAFEAWAAAKAREVDAFYVAVDLDCLDAAGNWAVQMPEPDGLSLETTVRVVTTLRDARGVVGLGATGINIGNGDVEATLDAVISLATAAFGAVAPGGPA